MLVFMLILLDKVKEECYNVLVVDAENTDSSIAATQRRVEFMEYVRRLIRAVGVPLVMAAFLGVAGCAAGASDEEVAQLNDLKNESASLEKQVSQKEQELSSLQKQLDAKNKELEQCKKDQEAAKKRLQGVK